MKGTRRVRVVALQMRVVTHDAFLPAAAYDEAVNVAGSRERLVCCSGVQALNLLFGQFGVLPGAVGLFHPFWFDRQTRAINRFGPCCVGTMSLSALRRASHSASKTTSATLLDNLPACLTDRAAAVLMRSLRSLGCWLRFRMAGIGIGPVSVWLFVPVPLSSMQSSPRLLGLQRSCTGIPKGFKTARAVALPSCLR
jgi:hypothetical protein